MRPARKLLGTIAVTGTLIVGIAGFGGVASALPPGATVVAAVTGTVNLVPGPTVACPTDNYEGDFKKVQIPGVFGDGTTTGVFPSVAISGTGTVTACGSGTLEDGVPILANGALKSAGFTGTGLCLPAAVACNLNGKVNGGSFTQLGATAVASIDLSYCLTTTTCTVPTTTTDSATAVIQVVPVLGPDGSGNCPGLAISVCEIAAGPVVG